MSIEQEGTSRLIYISSNNKRNPNETSSQFSIDLGASSRLHQVNRLVLRSVHFVNGQYNVREGHNTLKWNHNAIDYETTINSGFYNTTQLRAVLKTEMDFQMAGAGVTVVITQVPFTDKLEFTWSSAGGFIYTIENGSNLSPELGFITQRAGSNPYLADRQPELNGLQHCYLRSNVLAPANMIASDKVLDSTLINVPVTAPYLFVNHYEPYDDELASINYITPTDIRVVDIELQDDDFKPIDLNGYETEFVFKAYF